MAFPPFDSLIEPYELAWKIQERTDIKVLDGTFVMPGSGISPVSVFRQKRIGRASFFDIEEICDADSPLPHMLPQPEIFERAVAEAGISNDSTVVIYGQDGMIMGPCRVWWMFKIFGHDNVRILNGGLLNWEAEGYPLNTDPYVMGRPASFRANFRPQMVTDLETLQEIVEKGSADILDARSWERFAGIVEEPRAGLRSGHIPGSKNIPCSTLVDQKTGCLRKPEDLLQLFKEHGIKGDKPVITTCGSGVTACAIAFALNILGFQNVSVYDGSWAEWGQEKLKTPVATQ